MNKPQRAEELKTLIFNCNTKIFNLKTEIKKYFEELSDLESYNEERSPIQNIPHHEIKAV